MKIDENQLSFLEEIRRKASTPEGRISISMDSELISKLITTVADIDWTSFENQLTFQDYIDIAEKYIKSQKVILTEEGKYVSTSRPMTLFRVIKSEKRVRVTLATEILDEKTKLPNKRHISVTIDAKTLRVRQQ